MGILEQHQHRLPRRQPLDLRHQCLQRLLLLLLRGKVPVRVAFAGGERKERREQRESFTEVSSRLAEN